MSNNLQKSSIANKVINKIRKGQIKMRPKIYFILKTILVVLGIATIALFALYLVSFISFILRASGVWYLSGFGFRGILVLLHSLPWLLILIAVLLIVVLETLVKRFAFTYRRPILYSMLAIVILVLLGGFIVDKTQLHPALFRRAQQGHLPVAGKSYRNFGMPKFHDVHLGVVSEITDSGFLIETPRGEDLTVIITPEARFPFGTGIKENDTVIVLGEIDDGAIRASDIRKINDDIGIFPRGSMFEPRNILAPHRMPIAPSR